MGDLLIDKYVVPLCGTVSLIETGFSVSLY